MGELGKTPKLASASTSLLGVTSTDSYTHHGTRQTYTVDEGIESLGLGRFQYLVLAMAGLCWTADAMEMLLLSFIKPPLQCLWGISDVEAALITTSVGVGMLFGALIWGLIADSYGRRLAFIAAASLTFTFGLLSAVAPTYHAMLLTRGIVGFGIGGVPIAFSLIMEFLPSGNRGTFGLGLAVFWSLGAMLEATLAMKVVPHLGFRWLIGISTLPLGILLLLTPLVPESPRWLATQGRVTEAAAILRRAARVNGTALPSGTLVATPAATAASEHKAATQLKALVRPGIRSLSVKLWFLWFASAFVYYGSVMLQPDLLSSENLGRRCGYARAQCAAQRSAAICAADPICAWVPPLSSAATAVRCVPSGAVRERAMRTATSAISANCRGTLQRADYIDALWATSGEIPGVLLTLAVVDVIGRRPLLGYLFALCGCAFLVLLPCPGRDVETGSFFISRAASNGFFQAIYLYTNEIYPAEVRATGMGFASAVARVGLICTPLVAQFLDNVNFVLAIYIYSGMCLAGFAVVWLAPIETARRALFSSTDELIDRLMSKNSEQDGIPTFGNDPFVHPLIRFFRWDARIDGKASQVPGLAI